MHMNEIRTIAKQRGVKVAPTSKKIDLIRAIQTSEGNQSCFATDYNQTCNQLECLWRQACLQSTGDAK